MSFDTIMGILITGLPLEIFFLTWAWKWVARYIPEHRLKVLKEFVTDAVQMVEQMYTGTITSAQKKAMAIASAKNLLIEAHLPVPPDSIINDLVESAVYLLNINKTATPAQTIQAPADTSPLQLPRKADG